MYKRFESHRGRKCLEPTIYFGKESILFSSSLIEKWLSKEDEFLIFFIDNENKKLKMVPLKKWTDYSYKLRTTGKRNSFYRQIRTAALERELIKINPHIRGIRKKIKIKKVGQPIEIYLGGKT